MKFPQDDVLIIGAGATGLATALALSEAGRHVRVLDAGPIPPAAGHYKLNLPLVRYMKCDIPDYGLQGGIERPVLDQ